MRPVIRYLPMLMATLVVAGLTIYAFWPAAISVEVTGVTQGPLMVTVDEDGKTRVKERYVVSAPLSGLLGRIELHPGDVVKANETVLATIEPTDPALLDARSVAQAESQVKAAEAAKDQSRARLEAAREARDLAMHEFERAKKLIATQAISAAEFDSAEHQQHITAATLRAAEFGDRVATFELDQAKAAFVRTRPRADGSEESQRLELRSPVDGQVFRVIQENASVVSPGQPLVEIGDTRQLEMEIDVLSADATQVKAGARVLIEQRDGSGPLQAHVRLIEPSGFSKISALGVEEQRVNVIADFDEPAERLRGMGDGYRIDARIVIWESRNVLKVSTGALFRHGQDWAVYVVGNQRARLRLVTVGHMGSLETEVLEGLALHEQVVDYPSDKIRDGAAIKVELVNSPATIWLLSR